MKNLEIRNIFFSKSFFSKKKKVFSFNFFSVQIRYSTIDSSENRGSGVHHIAKAVLLASKPLPEDWTSITVFI